ncbi:SecY-interacting protein [Colwellia psychrerythraea]|uniref:Protein Syd n=1 Tax=Colwellia psychrerythraea (strain 34H / ATCC BAA-681) TaxID=167879 RepID=SYDP_COLP3|nr:SecY-interacting protein [Colwellia psychrerythraea]Q47YB4.1 RecName: Full=Protein Syd [Colwellia psychrerythraea 34H]AAZ24786.1 putative syd protein [Colwellia psychrerythraea 34H]
MTSTNKTLTQAILNFSKSYSQQHVEQFGHLPTVEHDEQWPSPCDLGSHDTSHHYWQAVAMESVQLADNKEEALSFENVESALNIELHPDIKIYFTTIFSGDIEAQSDDGELSLLFAWNKDDFERLQENIIGHILMKQKLKQVETVFFAVTDEEDMIISVDNSSGEVWVEQVGCKPHKKLSDSLAEFISQLTHKNVVSEKS